MPEFEGGADPLRSGGLMVTSILGFVILTLAM
jgi:hypothetical protein